MKPTSKRKIAIFGDGAWGTALALILNENGHSVTVWSPFPENIAVITQHKENVMFLPGIRLPEEIKWTSSREQAVQNAEIMVIAIPSKYFRNILTEFRGMIPHSCIVVSATKGLDPKTYKRMTEVISEVLPCQSVAAISGPSHAQEVAKKIPTAVVVASADIKVAVELQNIFSNHYFRVYSSDDISGVEFGGAFKNVIAVAVGISDGIGFGHNTSAALITRGLAEITRLGCALGAKPITFAGLSGMGDLIVTCTSGLSRNWATGKKIGSGMPVDKIINQTKVAIEGIWNCKAVLELARRVQVEAPITEHVHAVVYDGMKPATAVESLMSRPLKHEV